MGQTKAKLFSFEEVHPRSVIIGSWDEENWLSEGKIHPKSKIKLSEMTIGTYYPHG